MSFDLPTHLHTYLLFSEDLEPESSSTCGLIGTFLKRKVGVRIETEEYDRGGGG